MRKEVPPMRKEVLPVRKEMLNYFIFVLNRLADRSVSTPRNIFSPGCTGGSVKNKSHEYWILVYALLRRQWAENPLNGDSRSSSKWMQPREEAYH